MSTSTESPKDIAARLATAAAKDGVRFPKVWDEKQILQKCYATLMLFKEDDKFDESAALGNLIETYGQVKEAVTASESGQKKRKVVDKDAGDETVNTATAEKDEKDEKAKKIRASETVANEANRGIAEAILGTIVPEIPSNYPRHETCVLNLKICRIFEIASSYFKNGDRMKGGVYSKGAKAIRECETPIVTKKDALALKGVGKGMAAYIEEFHETGSINKLEELRAGTA